MTSLSRFRLQWSPGFTLIELLIVLAIMVLATTLFTSGMRVGTTGAELHEATQEMKAALDQTRSLAIAGNRVTALIVENGHLYREPRSEHRLSSRVSIALSGGSAAADNGSGSAIYFFPDGSSSGGEIAFAVDKTLGVVNVDWFTGHASIR